MFCSVKPTPQRVCTLIAAWQVFEDSPLVVVANRDEARDRPFEPPARRSWGRSVIAPKDSRAGGSWIGHNDEGVFVGLTNRWQQTTTKATRSRGLLVRDALAAPSTAAAVETLTETLTADAYNPCHLFVADETAAKIVVHDGPRTHPDTHSLSPGVHVLLNAGFNDSWLVPAHRRQEAKQQRRTASRIREHLTPPGTIETWREKALEVVSTHRFGRCLHGNGFGTRSSSVVQLGAQRSWQFASGPPCETTYSEIQATGTD